MAYQNPYSVALSVDPAKEQQVLAQLKTNPQKLAELGLAPDEDFSALKSDPVKYNKVLSYVKGEAYKSPAYAALSEGKTSPEFVQEQQAGGQYTQTPTEFRSSIRPGLQDQYGANQEKNNQILGQLKTENDQSVNKYIEDMNKYVRGEVGRDVYINALNNLSSAAGTLNNTKTNFDNAYKRYQDAEDMAVKGYGESRGEKTKAAQDMYDAAKELLDKSIADEKTYQTAQGKVLNPATGQYETKPTTLKPPHPTAPLSESDAAAHGIKNLLTKIDPASGGPVIGPDGFVSPQNYLELRNEWIKSGYNPTTFDTKFKGFRNPNNPNYITNKTSVKKSPTVTSPTDTSNAADTTPGGRTF